ncbi:MAG: hypothetical protein JNK46_19850 [Methylobacteriaceae bacterium]|nr:hypothetical protein [Methylobacteriaceae bacterium]
MSDDDMNERLKRQLLGLPPQHSPTSAPQGRTDATAQPAPPDAATPQAGVGYGRPPLSGRFQKGRSGNPRGRPRKAAPTTPALPPSTLAEALLQESRRRLPIREDGRTRQISMRRAVIKAQEKSALQGNAYAQRNYLDRLDRYEREERAAIAQDHAVWRGYEREARARLAKGTPVDQVLPHPDDLVFPDDARVRFAGPSTPAELAKTRHDVAVRDAALLEWTIDLRDKTYDREIAAGRTSKFGALLTATNNALPARMRLSDAEIGFRATWRLRPKRALRQELRRTWRALGCPQFMNLERRFTEVALIRGRIAAFLKAVDIAKREMEEQS